MKTIKKLLCYLNFNREHLIFLLNNSNDDPTKALKEQNAFDILPFSRVNLLNIFFKSRFAKSFRLFQLLSI